MCTYSVWEESEVKRKLAAKYSQMIARCQHNEEMLSRCPKMSTLWKHYEPKLPQERHKMASWCLFAAEPAREPESKSEQFARVFEGWGPSCTIKTNSFMSCVYMRRRRSQGDGQESERVEKAPFIICCKKWAPGTRFEMHFLMRAKNNHFILCFYYFEKIHFFRKIRLKKK